MMNIKQILEYGVKKLESADIDSKYIDARLILSHLLGKPIEYLISHYDVKIEDSIFHQYKMLIHRRQNHEPIAYIVGYKEFYGRSFKVNQNVLIPRVDTEILIDAACLALSNKTDKDLKILDLGTGSGIIAITLAKEVANTQLVAVDISDKSLDIARENAFNLGVCDRVEFIKSNWYKDLYKSKYDLIISNPPYIDINDQNIMSLETKKYEPNLALYADENGLVNYHIIFKNAESFLKNNGEIIVEIGYNQYNQIQSLCHKYGYRVIQHYQDLGGYVRALRTASK